MQMLKEAKI